jgi:hypothetical protein
MLELEVLRDMPNPSLIQEQSALVAMTCRMIFTVSPCQQPSISIVVSKLFLLLEASFEPDTQHPQT